MKAIIKYAPTIIGGIIDALLITELVFDIRKHFKTSKSNYNSHSNV